jgi:Zn-dependent protease
MYYNFFDLLGQVAIFMPALVFTLTFRGCFRALIANAMGDDTGKASGFLTLNPAAHIDTLGLVIVIVVLFVLGGLFPGALSHTLLLLFLIIAGVRWSHEVPVNEAHFRSLRWGSIATALAGPLGNFVLVLLCMYGIKYSQLLSLSLNVQKSVLEVLGATMEISAFFGVLHLVPLPPFDGGVLLRYLTPASMQNAINWIESNAIYILLAVLLLGDAFFAGLYKLIFIIKLLLWHLVI